MRTAHGVERRGETGVEIDKLRDIGSKMTSVPAHMKLNSKLVRIIDTRAKKIAAGEGLDWATAEHLAFGSIVLEGDPVRLSGQDSAAAAPSASVMPCLLIRRQRNATRRWRIWLRIRRCSR